VRNCAWTNQFGSKSGRAVWARRDIVSLQCPKSVISAQSKNFLEQFRLWKQFGGGFPLWTDAKTADALLVLEEAWRVEEQSEET
jgi:hypothetical protein